METKRLQAHLLLAVDEKDDQAFSTLSDLIKKMEETLTLPEDNEPGLVKVETEHEDSLRIEFPILRLSRDDPKVVHGRLETPPVLRGEADTHVHRDLLDVGDSHDVRDGQPFLHLRNDLVSIAIQ